MKRFISVLLAVMLLLGSFVSASAEVPPYSKDFDSKESMLSALSEYCESFPNVEDYFASDLSAERPNMHLERKKVVIPNVTADGYSATSYSYGDVIWGSGVNSVTVVYESVDDMAVVSAYFHKNSEQIDETLESMSKYTTKNIYSGTVNSNNFVANEQIGELASMCTYYIDLGNKLVIVYAHQRFNREFLESIELETTDISLPVYVDNHDGCYSETEDGDCINPDHEHSQKGDKYSEQFEQYLKNLGYSSESENWYEYNEVYEYFAQGNNTHIPDWILASGSAGAPSPAESNGIFGEYNLKLSNVYTPVGLYHIYIPSTNQFMSLEDAWTKKIANIKEAFTEYFVPNGYAELIEDSDGDGVITKVDAEKYDGYFTFYNSFDCIEEAYLHFDANSTDWEDYKKVFCHIWEYGGDSFYAWQTKAEGCTDEDKDGVWTYDLDKAKIKLEPGKKYAVIFSNEKGEQTYHLELRTTHIGETAYLTQKIATDANTDYRVPAWRTQCLYFDANTTNWKNYKKIFCHIWEYGGDCFFNWHAKKEQCRDDDKDGIWTYDLASKGIELDASKQYVVIFSNENAYQTYNLIFDKTVLGDTAYCDGTNYESPEDARYPQIAYWRNQDKAKFGPEMQIDLMGNVQGTCIPKSKTKHGLFKDFLTNGLENAQTYSGKTDQALLDDLAKELKISADDVERAVMETGVDVEWKHPDKLSVKEAVKNYEEKTGKKVDTIRYYFLMPNGSNGQLRTDDVDGNPFAPSWYNTYANKPGVYWWDVAAGLDPPVFPGYYFDESESKDVYYVDLPKDVKSVLWNNYIFESMDTADDPMRAYSRYTDEAILPHQIYSFIPGEQPNGWIYVVDPDTEVTSEFSGKQTFSGNWYCYYGNGCYGETSDGECIRGDHDHRVYDTYIVAGVEKLCGSSWDATDTNNKMTYNEKTGAYEITYTNVPVGNHEFMVTKNFEFGSLTPGSPDYNEAKVTVDGSIVRIAYTEGVGVSVEVIAPIIGDVDLDGVVSIMDATEIQLAVAKKKTLSKEQEKLADTDNDGEISIMDATAIQLFVAKKITQFK